MDETMRKKLESIYSVEEWEKLPQQTEVMPTQQGNSQNSS